MLNMPDMLMIGAAGRNVGKTELACSIIRQFSRQHPIVGIKVTTVTRRDGTCPRGGKGCGVCSSLTDNYCITVEHGDQPDKDTSRLLAAGAERVYWLRVMSAHLSEGLDALLKTIGPDTVSICESNSLRSVVEPGLFLMVRDSKDSDFKASALAVSEHADITLLSDNNGPPPDTSPVNLIDHRWKWKHNATAVILAGGASTRMKRDKSMLPIDGRPMLRHIHDQLHGNFTDIIISSNSPDTGSFPGTRIVPDRAPGKGPLMGIASALAASNSELNFVTGCDVPDICMPLVRRMLDSADGYDAVVPRTTNGLLEPLFAVYRRGVANIMHNVLAAGKTRVREIFDCCRVNYIDVPADRQPKNLNTCREYEAYVAERKRNDTI